MLVVAALGGRALRPSAEPLGLEHQAAWVDEAARYLSAIADEHHLVVTHGFGPCPGPPGLEQAMARRLPSDRLATVPTRIVLRADGLPRSIVELRTFRILVDNGVAVLCPGNGCVPTGLAATSGRRTVVTDGGLVAARLATELDADALLLLTRTDGGGDAGEPVGATAAQARVVSDFVDAGGWIGAVGRLHEAADMLRAGPGVVTPGHDTGAPAAIAGA